MDDPTTRPDPCRHPSHRAGHAARAGLRSGWQTSVRALRRAGAFALLLAAAAVVVPAAAPALPAGLSGPVVGLFAPAVARAADDELEIVTSAVYVVDAGERRVRVGVDLGARNRKPNTARGGVVTRYRYDGASVALPREAVRIRAVDGGARLRVAVQKRDGFKLVTVTFRRPIYFGDRTSLRVTFDLPAGKPRSGSGVRIGEAFVTFPVWAYGDRSSVRVEVPSRYTVATRGAALTPAGTERGTTVLTAATDDPLGWFSFVDGTNDAALASRELSLADGDRVLLRGWPEDKAWRRTAGNLLADGIPELQRRIGLPWPVAGTLAVTEVHTPLLEGYAGFYDPSKAQITIGEQLDRATLLHEASHAWFNGSLFSERWITEGLAEEYAARTLRALGGKAESPPKTSRDAKGAFPLASWPPPSAIGDRAAARRERFGYAASWTVIRRIVRAAGEPGMRRVFAVAAARTTAYPGDGPPERSALPNDWRRLVDLAEEVGGAANVASIVAAWAVSADQKPSLTARTRARDAYHALVARGSGWAGPLVVRSALDAWDFTAARDAITAAGTVLDARDRLATAAAADGLTVPPALEAGYEGASTAAALEAARKRIDAAAAALPSLTAAEEAIAAPRDWLADLGLGDEDPSASLEAARAAWASGQVEAAGAAADELAARVSGASDAGAARLRTLALLPALAALGLVGVGLLLAARRRSPGRRAG